MYNNTTDPQSTYVYLTATAEFKTRKFDTYVPEKYFKSASDDFLLDPDKQNMVVYEPMSCDDEAFAKLSPEELLNILVSLKGTFRTSDQSFITIFFITDNYIQEMASSILSGDPNILAYMRKVITFRNMLYNKFLIVINRNKWTKQHIINTFPEAHKLKLILELKADDDSSIHDVYKDINLSDRHLSMLYPRTENNTNVFDVDPLTATRLLQQRYKEDCDNGTVDFYSGVPM